jgi:two-component sensor histidine kinase
VSIETALPLGLITNELLTNAFKYAFPIQQQGEITIQLVKGEGDMLTLTVKDNGIGLPKNFNMDSQTSLGMFIIRLLVEQLDGNIVHLSDNGTSFSIQFLNVIPATNFSPQTPQP